MKRISWRTCGIVCSLLLLILAGLYGYGSCIIRFDNSPIAHGCYKKNIDRLGHQRGLPFAVNYVRDVVYPAHGYSLVHFMLHYVGELAFQENPDIHSLHAFLEPYSGEMLHGGFDGIAHGYITTYMSFQKQPLEKTARDICESDADIPGVTGDDFTCYHTLGHALMHGSGNVLEDALNLCDVVASSDDKRNACYYGVFMENGFLYYAPYHPDSPRPDVSGTSMRGVCERFSGDRARLCEIFVGDSFLSRPPHDIAGAFSACVGLRWHPNCAERLGSMTIASLSRNLDEARTICTQYTNDDISNTHCLIGAGAGLREGTRKPVNTLSKKILNTHRTIYYTLLLLLPPSIF